MAISRQPLRLMETFRTVIYTPIYVAGRFLQGERAKSDPRARKMVVVLCSGAEVDCPCPHGLDQVELKWGVPASAREVT